MRLTLRWTGGALSALFLIGMIALFLDQPTITYPDRHGRGEDVRVECGSVAGTGWPGNATLLLDETGSGRSTDSIDGRNIGPVVRAGIYRDCDQLRTTYTGAMALAAVPTILLATLATRRRKPAATRREPAGGTA